MILINALSVHDENKNAIVIGINGATLAVYDGKNAIDEQYNDCEIVGISCDTIGGKSAVVYCIDAE